jgi:hypothetical protein
MYNTMDAYGDLAAIYFILYVFLGPMVMIFLLIAYVWDFYFEEFKKVKMEEQAHTDFLQWQYDYVNQSEMTDGGTGNPDAPIHNSLEDYKSNLGSLRQTPPMDKVNQDFSKYRVQKSKSIAYMKRQIGRTKKTEEHLKREKSAILEKSANSMITRENFNRGYERNVKNSEDKKVDGIGEEKKFELDKNTSEIILLDDLSHSSKDIK